MPLLQAVTAAYDAAVAHATKCGTCWPDMHIAEMCADGQREALASLDHADGEPQCAHVAWEVTSEHHNELGTWTKSRRCSDCDEPLSTLVKPEPHWPENNSGLARIRRTVREGCRTARHFKPVESAGEPGPMGWTFATGRAQWTRYGAVMADGRALGLHLTRIDVQHQVLNEDAKCV
ncbi:hypothetical protein ACFU6S_16895 [Streptomyces sp. NPDC057456]|uniref:hypothetical protein n=1 Tax=Streptomyces sp. NPDC057456 TaxID=3346139 RepID=UPI00368BBF1A